MAQEHHSQKEIGLSSRLHSLIESLHNLDVESFPDVYRVPEELREGNEKYYTPTTISIGPLHAASDNPSLTAAVKLKKRALKFFLSNVPEVSLDYLFRLLKGKEGEARMCYNAEEIKVKYSSSDAFVEMMLLDGCFILALIAIEARIIGGEDPVFMGRARGPLFYSIQQDLLLLENQLPFFVLKTLWNATLHHRLERDSNLIEYALQFFIFVLPGQICDFSRYKGMKPKHLLELVLFAFFPLPPRNDNHAILINSLQDFPKNMSELALYGIKIESNHRGNSFADVKFSNGVLAIPTLVIEESTTSLFKNLLALEQCQNQKRSCFTSYLFFMDALVDTDKDIDLLLQAGVLRTWLNDKQALVSLLSGLNTNLLFSIEDMAAFETIFAELKNYCGRRRHQLRALFMRDYYASMWDIINSILIFIFTITQTVFAILSYNPRK